jgi:hypothetical protein
MGRSGLCGILLAGLLCLVVSESLPQDSQWQTYKGAWFDIRYPPGFQPKPSLRSPSSATGYDSVFFLSPDRTAEFYVFSPQWGGIPTDIAVKPKTEVLDSQSERREKGRIFREATVRARDGSYIRSYVIIEDTRYNTSYAFGYRYRDRKTYERYRPAYLKFKRSLRQYAD